MPTAAAAVLVLVAACAVRPSSSIPIDNGLAQEPEIACGASAIAVGFNTQSPFGGHVYVKGRYAQDDCRNDYDGTGDTAEITLPFDACGVKRRRSLNPKGVFVSVTVVVSFHPSFLTKIDRALLLQCFYMEAEKSVSAELEVSMLTTAFQTQVVPMPICRYDILDADQNGSPLRFASIGQKAYHLWRCDTETVDTFCMRVHSCFVDDGAGDRILILDENGCSVDRYVLGNIEYLADLMAGRETHAFKYADRADVFFDCQISIVVKEPFGQCQRPNCPDPVRGKRDASALNNRYGCDQPWTSCLDVASQSYTVADPAAGAFTDSPTVEELLRGDEESELVCLTSDHMYYLFGPLITCCVVLTMILFYVTKKKTVRVVYVS